MRPFDLNMEEVLEDWEVYHAVREIISNALDEQLMTKTADIEIMASDTSHGWHIRDFGRGIQIEHFTQNENQEKHAGPEGIIGKFGVGLKDALATLYRKGMKPVIRSAFGTYTIAMHQKEGFADIETLHVMFDDRPNTMVGTDFFIEGIDQSDVEQAKDLFLKFNDAMVLESTKYGEVLQSDKDSLAARVYINGVLASEEENFLFSYNITNLTKSMRKALNRERTNVGRSTYTERVKSILKSCSSDEVLEGLAEQIRDREKGNQCDEIRWADIAQIGIAALSERDGKVIYATAEEIMNNPDYLGDMQRDGYTIITVSEKDHDSISSENARTFADYVSDFNHSFEFEFIEEDALSDTEKEIFGKTSKILDLVGWSNQRPPVRISETMRPETDASAGNLVLHDARGCYSILNGIIIKRSELASLERYASVLLHEAAHASSGATDATREFESELTEYLGRTACKGINC